jgi:hypothetical protein
MVATDPAFASTPRAGAAIITALETSLTVPTQAVTVITAGASGSLLSEVVINAVTTSLTPTTVAGLVYLFLFDGTTYHLFDVLAVTAVTASATVSPFRTNKLYAESVQTGWSVRASNSISGNSGLLKVTCFVGDF